MQVKKLNENSDKFDPKRFNDERKSFVEKKTFVFISFVFKFDKKNKKPLRSKKEIP